MIALILVALLFAILFATILGEFVGWIAFFIIGIIFFIWLIKNWRDVLDFILAIFPLFIMGILMAGGLYILIKFF